MFNLDLYTNEECINRISNYPELVQLLQNILYDTDNFYIRDSFGDGIADVLCYRQNEAGKFAEFKKIILKILLFDTNDKMKELPTRCYKSNDIITRILVTTSNQLLSSMEIDFEKVLDLNIDIITAPIDPQQSSQDE